MGIGLELTERTDEQLAAEAAREGSDGPAFVALVERYSQRVWRICYRLLGNADDASDAAQEVFVRLFVSRGKFQARSKYSTWVHGLAVRTCLALRRSRGRRRRREGGPEAMIHEAQAPDARRGGAALSDDLLEMLDELDEIDRALVILKYAESYSYEELASIFELSVSACKMRVSRARDRVQRKHADL